MRTVLLLVALWAGVGAAGLRGWAARRPLARRDAQLRALLSGVVVPAPRAAANDAMAELRAG